jgi:hypothetical protein
MSQLDPRIQVYLFQIINYDVWMYVCMYVGMYVWLYEQWLSKRNHENLPQIVGFIWFCLKMW